MATWEEIVTGALADLGVLALGDEADQTDMNHGLERAASMLSSWSDEGLLVPGTQQLALEVTAANTGYRFTVGDGDRNDFDSEVPPILHSVLYRDHGDRQWRKLDEYDYATMKRRTDFDSLQSGYPSAYNWQPTHPVGTLILNRNALPDDGIELHTEGYVATPGGSGFERADIFPLPRSYENPVRANLSLLMAPAYGLGQNEISPITYMEAKDGKARLRKRNTKRMEMTSDPGMPMYSGTRMNGRFRRSRGRGSFAGGW